jgi:hypothetical protein
MAKETTPSAICIVGDSRSGSTIFQGLLELHRDVTAVGELRRLEKFIAHGQHCSCGEPIVACPHWREIMQRAGLQANDIRTQPPSRKVLQRFEEASGFAGVALHMTTLTRRLLYRGAVAADHSARVLAAAAEIAGARLVVDNSKDPGHAVYLLHQNKFPVHIVFNIREGHATIWSKMRRTGISVDEATRHWARTTRAMLALHRFLGPERCSWLRYEDLCADPRRVVERFETKFELDPGGFVSHSDRGYHHIGGTPDYAGISFETVQEDTRWRSEMPAAAQTEFESVAGDLNRRLGYSS